MSTIAMDPAHDTAGQPPHDYQAEQSCLGAMMLSSPAISAVLDTIEPGDFWPQKHQAIAHAIRELNVAGTPCDPMTVAAELDRRGELARCGHAPYLHTLIATVPTAENAAYYAEIVRTKAIVRRAGEVGTHLQQLAEGVTGGAIPESFIPSVQAAVEDLAAKAAPAKPVNALSDLDDAIQRIQDACDGITDPTRVSTGFVDLDNMLGGVAGGQLITVAARSGVGKSTLALDLCRAAALRSADATPVMLVSQEMSRGELWKRLLAADARIRLHDMTTGHMSADDWTRLARRRAELANEVRPGEPRANLIDIHDDGLTVSEIEIRAHRLQQTRGLSMIVVDYVQITQPEGGTGNREQEVAQITRRLKQLATRLNVPVVALSQLNRKVDDRDDKTPRTSDLRESSAIEQDSDIVLLLHRPDAFNRDDPRAGEADLIVAKHRNGPTGTIAVAHQLHYSRFADLARDF